MKRSSLLLAFARLADITGSLGIRPRPKDAGAGYRSDAEKIGADFRKAMSEVDALIACRAAQRAGHEAIAEQSAILQEKLDRMHERVNQARHGRRQP